MAIDSRLVLEQAVLLRSMRHGHDVHIVELRPAFAPIAMGENLVTPDFAARLNFAPVRHRPMKQCVEARDARAGLAGLDVFEKSRESTDQLAIRQRFGDREETPQTIPRLRPHERSKAGS